MESVLVPVTPRTGGKAVPAGTPHKVRSREESGQAEAAPASAQEWELVLAQEWDPGLGLVSDQVLGLESGQGWALDLVWVWGLESVLDPEWDLELASAQEWEWETVEVLGLGPAWVLDPVQAGTPHRQRDQSCSSGP